MTGRRDNPPAGYTAEEYGADVASWLPTSTLTRRDSYCLKAYIDQLQTDLKESEEACHDLMCLNDELSKINERAEKMLKVVEAAVKFVTSHQDKSDQAWAMPLVEAVSEYQEVME